MKKILSTALLVAAGTALASAASAIPSSLNDDTLLYYWDFSTSNDPVKNVSNTTWNDKLAYNDAGYGSYSAASEKMWSTTISNANIAANSFTISFDFANFQSDNWCDLFSLYTDNAVFGTNSSLQLQKTGDDALGVYVGGDASSETPAYFGGLTGNGGADNVITGVIGADWQTVTLTADGKNICVYLDGSLMTSIEAATTNTLLTGLQFGTAFGSTRSSKSADIDNIAIWNRPLSSAEVASLIPEPSAFGLLAGLGALALVASRRRRK